MELQLYALKRLLPLDGPLIVLGDFNAEPDVVSKVLTEGTGIKRVPLDHTIPTESSPHHVDQIYYRGLCLEDYGIANTIGISDHLPVWAAFDAPDGKRSCN